MKILLDTDIGSDIDDALALLLLLHLPDVEIVGITTTYGNVGIRAKVVRKILDAANVSIPVFAGTALPLGSPEPLWHTGTEGKGLLNERDYAAPLDVFNIRYGADEFIAELISANRGEITLVALGALTNVAEAIRRKPKICEWVNECYFMGGGVTYRDPVPTHLEDGETYRAAPSHNVRCDVEAARIVLASRMPMRILTNDVTTSLWWDGHAVQQLMHDTTPPVNAVVGKLLRVWLDYRTEVFGREITGTCLHDPVTVAEAAGHSFAKYVPGTMSCSPDASTTFTPSKHGRHLAATEIDHQRFLSWFQKQLLV